MAELELDEFDGPPCMPGRRSAEVSTTHERHAHFSHHNALPSASQSESHGHGRRSHDSPVWDGPQPRISGAPGQHEHHNVGGLVALRERTAAIPGPAGAIASLCTLNDSQNHPRAGFESPLFSQRRVGGITFRRTGPWMKLAELMDDQGQHAGDMQVQGRISLEDLRVNASKPPRKPPLARLLCAVIKSIESEGGNGGEDVAAVLADESGEFHATLHTGIFNEHPGCVGVGAAMALKDVAVLSLAPWSHHLIVHPNCVLHICAPAPPSTPHSSAPESSPSQQAERRANLPDFRNVQCGRTNGIERNTRHDDEDPTPWSSSHGGHTASIESPTGERHGDAANHGDTSIIRQAACASSCANSSPLQAAAPPYCHPLQHAEPARTSPEGQPPSDMIASRRSHAFSANLQPPNRATLSNQIESMRLPLCDDGEEPLMPRSCPSVDQNATVDESCRGAHAPVHHSVSTCRRRLPANMPPHLGHLAEEIASAPLPPQPPSIPAGARLSKRPLANRGSPIMPAPAFRAHSALSPSYGLLPLLHTHTDPSRGAGCCAPASHIPDIGSHDLVACMHTHVMPVSVAQPIGCSQATRASSGIDELELDDD